jgi:hypothetical protein
MAKAPLPVYDTCTIDQRSQRDLLIECFGTWLEKHYHNLNTLHRHSFYPWRCSPKKGAALHRL